MAKRLRPWALPAEEVSGSFEPAGGRWYVYYVIALCVLFAVSLVVEAPSLPAAVRTAPAGFLVLAVLAVVVDTPLVTIQRPSAPPVVLTSVTFCYAMSYGFGHGTARVTQVLAVVAASAFARRRFWPSAFFDVGRYGLALAAASTVATAIGRPIPTAPDPENLLGVLAAALAWYLTFRLLTATGVRLNERCGWTEALVRNLPAEAVSAGALLLLSPMLILLVYADPWLIPLVLAPIYAVSLMARLYSAQQQRATRDALTGLPNRLALSQVVDQPIQRCVAGQPDAGVAALLVVDIAQLGRINEALGHRVGDGVLVAVARRISGQADGHTLVARLQSDEFAIFMWALADVDEVLARAAAVRARFDEPVSIDGQALIMSVSIGISLCPIHGTNFETLERHADTAMERAKGLPQPVAIFRPDQDEPTADQLSLLADLRRALDEPASPQIVPFYQPQVDMSTGDVVAVEALLRWQHPTRGMVSPDQVVRVAEHTPLMREVTMTMVEQVLAHLATWRSEGWELHASVNVSVHDLYGSALVDWVSGRLRHYDVPADQLQLEITESALMSQTSTVLGALQSLRRLGVGVSLDDFGTGFSSLQHLRLLPLTEIKIDQSFVRSMMDNQRDNAIVRAVIDLGRDLGVRVVAEGVEDDQTKLRLLSDGCHVAQGWYYASPMPAKDLVAWLSRRAEHI